MSSEPPSPPRPRQPDDSRATSPGISRLALVTAAIALWNTVYLGRALDDLSRSGEKIPESLRAHLAPIGWQHINLTGDYLWDANASLGLDDFRQLRGGAPITVQAARRS